MLRLSWLTECGRLVVNFLNISLLGRILSLVQEISLGYELI